MDVTSSVGWLTILVSFGIVTPELAAGFGVERDDFVVRGAEVKDAINHQRSVFEHARPRAELRQRDFAGFPGPGQAQSSDVFCVHAGELGIFHSGLGAAVERPLDLRAFREEQRGTEKSYRCREGKCKILAHRSADGM